MGAKQASIASGISSSVWRFPPQLGTKSEVLVPEPCLPRLSLRERQTLRCLVSGQPNKAIATELGVAETTVKAANRTQAAIWAIDNSQLFGKDDVAVNALDGTFALGSSRVMEGFDAELFGAAP